jgi:hypothetical protein
VKLVIHEARGGVTSVSPAFSLVAPSPIAHAMDNGLLGQKATGDGLSTMAEGRQ